MLSQELADKFYLPSVILEARSFKAAVRAGNLNPFEQDAIIVCSYQFARGKEPYLRQTAWDLIVIDEAHNLCTPEPATPVEKLLTERIVQIAAEGRKYGLWLRLSTQRPQPVLAALGGDLHPSLIPL